MNAINRKAIKSSKEKIIELINKNGGADIDQLCKSTGLHEHAVERIISELIAEGYDIVCDISDKKHFYTIEYPQIENNYVHSKLWSGNPIKLGLISDTHMGISPQYMALDELRTTLEIFRDHGVSTVLHAGDITHGVSSRHQGLMYEMAPGVVGADDQVNYVVENYPRIEGLTTYFITGSHDLWVYNKSGFDVGRAIDRLRDDMVYLGPESANVFVGPKHRTRIMIHHPDGGSSYAISYRPQKLVEAMSGGEKPHLYIIGHFHRFGIFRPRNVITIMLPGFQWNSPFYKRKGLEPEVGGVYLEMDVAEAVSYTHLTLPTN